MINTRFVVSFLLFYTKIAFILFATAESVWIPLLFLTGTISILHNDNCALSQRGFLFLDISTIFLYN